MGSYYYLHIYLYHYQLTANVIWVATACAISTFSLVEGNNMTCILITTITTITTKDVTVYLIYSIDQYSTAEIV